MSDTNQPTMTSSQHGYKVRPRRDKRGVDLISDALPFGRLCMASQMQSATQLGYAKVYSRSTHRVCRLLYAPLV
jgi:hypothetical protein